jgi:hypothetical protein
MNRLDWVRSQLRPNETPGEAVVRLNFRISVPNPTPQGTIPDPVTIPELLDLTTPERIVELMELSIYKEALFAYNSGNERDALAFINKMHEAGVITPAEYEAILAELSKTIPDPDWEPQVMLSLAEQAGHGFVSYEEIAEAVSS